MNQKIEWYQEVLTLEPTSKVFFPLAKLQIQHGDSHAAIQTLQHGLEYHPEYMEARLLLVDLLFASGITQELRPQVDRLTSVLSEHSGFWSAWMEALKAGGLTDAALAMAFLKASLHGEHISWGDIIQHGLAACLSATGSAVPVPVVALSAHQQKDKTAAVEHHDEGLCPPKITISTIQVSRAGDQQAHIHRTSVDGVGASEPSVHEPAQIACTVSKEPQHDTAQVQSNVSLFIDDEPIDEEPFTLHTRSMADLLVEQGDYAGAMAIYEELQRKCIDPSECAALDALIASMQLKIATPMNSPTHHVATGTGGGKARLMSMLDSLAQRLEAKGRES